MKPFKEFLTENYIFNGKEAPKQLIKNKKLSAFHVSKSPSLNINNLRSYKSDESILHHMHIGTKDQAKERANFSWSEGLHSGSFFLYKVTIDTTKMVPVIYQQDDPEFEALEYEKQGYTTLCYMNAHESAGDEASIVVMNKNAILSLNRIAELKQPAWMEEEL